MEPTEPAGSEKEQSPRLESRGEDEKIPRSEELQNDQRSPPPSRSEDLKDDEQSPRSEEMKNDEQSPLSEDMKNDEESPQSENRTEQSGQSGNCENEPSVQGNNLNNKQIVISDQPTAVTAIANAEVTIANGIIRIPPEKRSLYKFGQRSSNFRGVTRHRWTGKFEAHLWDNTSVSDTRKRKGKQVYLGGYEAEEKAAQAYDLAALKYWGPSAAKLNFPIPTYEKEIEFMTDLSREEYVNHLRRKSICFTRGHSIYRGVTSRQHEGRRWQARIGRVAGGKDIYLGTYDTEEEAAEAYDIAAVKLRGMNAITNFDISNYYKEGTKELDVIPIKQIEEENSKKRIRYFRLDD
ncbi:hypothetical protein Syun_023671 [Stephania yunnanensis]|uniref:AP2/ERF domain-containing protein n=1 Tax=Stephania yunnanensis TaxID=152371 RepID=A0AAP0FCR0_9MAGN